MTWFGRQMMSYKTDDLEITYKYDTDGLRTQKTVNGVEYNYYYVDGQLTYESNDTYDYFYRYDKDGRLGVVVKRRLSDNYKWYFYPVTNSRGDIMELHNGPGQVTARYNYDAWGKLISITDADGKALADGSFAHLISARYRGYYYDSETGLYYLQSRYYDPEVGRFLNADMDYILEPSLLEAELLSAVVDSGVQVDLSLVSAYSTRTNGIVQENLDCIVFLTTLSILLELNGLPLSYLEGGSYSWRIDNYYIESDNFIEMVTFYSEKGAYDYIKGEYVLKVYEFVFFYGTKSSWDSYLASQLGVGLADYLLLALNAISVFLDIIAWVYPAVKGLTVLGAVLTGLSAFGDGFSWGKAYSVYKVKSYIDEQGASLSSQENIALLYKVVLKTIIGAKTKEEVIFEF